MVSKGTEHATSAMYRQCARPDGTLDEEKLRRLMVADQQKKERKRTMALVAEPPGPTPQQVAAHPSVPRTKTTRGPWVLSIEGLGRPLTFNAERTSSMSRGTMVKVRQTERTWVEAVSDAAVLAGVPVLERAYVAVQTYYPTNVVPDPDATPGAVKACLDGLVRAGVLPDDRRTQLPFGYNVLPPITDGQDVRLTVTVFPLP